MSDARRRPREEAIDPAPLAPLCIAGCAWFTRAAGELGHRGHGLCNRYPQTVHKKGGDFCGDFETLDDYRRRRKIELQT